MLKRWMTVLLMFGAAWACGEGVDNLTDAEVQELENEAKARIAKQAERADPNALSLKEQRPREEEALRENTLKARRRLRGAYTDNFHDMIIHGDAEDLRRFVDFLSENSSRHWRSDPHWLEERAKALRQIDAESLLRVRVNTSSANGVVQKSIDAWPGDFSIANALPTARRCKCDKDK
jgi:hypothetical protein